MSSCHSDAEVKKVTASCCDSESDTSGSNDTSASCCGTGDTAKKRDKLLWGSLTLVIPAYLIAAMSDHDTPLPHWLHSFAFGVHELLNQMWWGMVIAVVFVGLLERIPREKVMAVLGPGGTTRGIFRATLAGVLLDLCSHGILMVGAKLYERGASAGQLMAFLLASPWNSLSLTIILVALVGWQWTLTFIALSMVIGMLTGYIFDRLVARGTLPENPNPPADSSQPVPTMKQIWHAADWSPRGILKMLADGVRDSRMVFRWLFFGIVLATAIRALVPVETYQSLFGPTMLGLWLTMIAATIIEVCSEGSTPIAADLVTRAAAPGNGFTFLMAGVATDYTEIMVLKDVTRSWKLALFLPLISLPQVMFIGWLLNSLS